MAKTAAKGISDLQIAPESESAEEEDSYDKVSSEEKTEDEDDRMRKNALDRLEQASDESIFGQVCCIFTGLYKFSLSCHALKPKD